MQYRRSRKLYRGVQIFRPCMSDDASLLTLLFDSQKRCIDQSVENSILHDNSRKRKKPVENDNSSEDESKQMSQAAELQAHFSICDEQQRKLMKKMCVKGGLEDLAPRSKRCC